MDSRSGTDCANGSDNDGDTETSGGDDTRDSDSGEDSDGSDSSSGDLKAAISAQIPNNEIRSQFRQWLVDHFRHSRLIVLICLFLGSRESVAENGSSQIGKGARLLDRHHGNYILS